MASLIGTFRTGVAVRARQKGHELMAWNYHTTRGFEAALLRASREIMAAAAHAERAGDESVLERLSAHTADLQGIRQSSIERAGRPIPVKIPGQTSIPF